MTTNNSTKLDTEQLYKDMTKPLPKDFLAWYNREWRKNAAPHSKYEMSVAYQAGKPKCQRLKTEYCKCQCGKHKENGDY